MATENPHNTSSFIIGWIAALSHELTAARMMLDEEYLDDPKHFAQHTVDHNTYTWGRICNHLVVIAVLPSGRYGTSSAQAAAIGMLASLPNIRVGLMVGIGAGVPTAGIRLGDIVVSQPESTHGGVVQYDAYKAKSLSNGHVEELRGFLNAPPDALLATLARLKSTHDMGDSAVDKFLREAYERRPNVRKYDRPAAVDSDPEQTTVSDTLPKVHYGTIASGEVLFKNATQRDDVLARLARANIKAICFEMEAAGLMNNFPCLVIRGICDYADERKNDAWQNYAAMTAAAFAKDFLKHVQRSRSEQTCTIREVLKQIQSDVTDIYTTVRREQEHSQQNKLDKWLSAPDASSNYDKALKQRHDGTGTWFLQSDAFTNWKDSPHSFLWLHGILGCGKTVLSTVIIEHLGELKKQDDSLIVAVIYFYFDFSDETKRTVDSMARSLISQCSCQSKSAQRQLDQHFQSHVEGNKQPPTGALLATLLSILEHMGQIRIVLDALDECTTRKELLQWIEGLVAPRAKTLQVIVTSRKEHDIELGISSWARVDESLSLQGAAVNDDIRAYVEARIEDPRSDLKRWRSRPDVKAEITSKLMEKAKGMFLLAACQLDVLEECLDLPDLREALATLPETLYKTYNRILENIPKKHTRHAIRILQFLTYSERPLRVEEAVDAIAVTPMADSRFDVQDRLADAREIARVCSSLVTVVHVDQISQSYQNEDQLQLAHLSVKEYLMTGQLESSFQDQLRESTARSTIAKVCLVYLLSLDHSLLAKQIRIDFPLSVYAARYWMENALLDEGKDIIMQALISKLFSSRAKAYCTWLYIYNPDYPWKEESGTESGDLPEPLYYVSLRGMCHSMHSILEKGDNINAQGGRFGSALNAASARGKTEAVNLLLDTGKVELNTKDDLDGRTPLSWAARGGYEAVVKLLLDTGHSDVNSKDTEYGSTALSWAAASGHEEVVKLLLDTKNVEVDSKDNTGRTPFSWAAHWGQEATTKLLLDTGKVEVDSKANTGQTPLSWAAARGRGVVVKLLLDTGKVEVDLKDNTGRTPFSWAAEGGHEVVTKLLLDTGKVEVDSKDNTGRTPLSWAARGKTKAVVKLLLDTGKVEVDSKDNTGRTPFSWAAEGGHEEATKLLLDTGKVEVDSKDNTGRTPLSWAADWGEEAVVKLLLDTGKVEVASKDNTGRTPLSWAVHWGREAVVKLLLDTGKVEVDSKDNTGRTPLSWAARWKNKAVVKLLLDTGKVEVDSKDNTGRTPLSWAAHWGQEAVVKLLLDTGKVEVDSKDNTGRTPFSWAAEGGHEAATKLLLDRGKVEVASKDNTGRTPLWWAAELGHQAVVKLLLDTGKAEINSKDSEYGMTTLSWAAEGGHDEIVKLLLDTGEVDVDSKDNDDRTALSLAAEGGHEAVVKLLLDIGEVNVDSKDSDDRTALSWAAEGGHEAVVKLLLDTGKIEVDSKDSE
ncbi:hypothetical protein LTR17_019202 [Elasticomyces elasticus]|nr:hypothetical protein LTR17_019202 [Elasticomyces elasticus]